MKGAQWASGLSELPADTIRGLARRMARSRTFIIVNWSLQRGDHGEQPLWAAIALAAILGQIGLPGGGFGFGYGSMEGLAGLNRNTPYPALPIGHNPVRSFIPVARISDLLLNPGQSVPVRRPRSDLSGHPARVLVRRQSISPSSGHQPADPRLAAAGNRDRERCLVDGDGSPLGYRAARDHHARARRRRRERRAIGSSSR